MAGPLHLCSNVIQQKSQKTSIDELLEIIQSLQSKIVSGLKVAVSTPLPSSSLSSLTGQEIMSGLKGSLETHIAIVDNNEWFGGLDDTQSIFQGDTLTARGLHLLTQHWTKAIKDLLISNLQKVDGSEVRDYVGLIKSLKL